MSAHELRDLLNDLRLTDAQRDLLIRWRLAAEGLEEVQRTRLERRVLRHWDVAVDGLDTRTVAERNPTLELEVVIAQ